MDGFKTCPYTGAEVPITYLPYGGDGPLPSHNVRFSGSYKDYLRTCIRAGVVAEHFRKDSWESKPLILFPKKYPDSVDPVRMLKVPVLTQDFLKEWFVRLASSSGKSIHNEVELEHYLTLLEIEVRRFIQDGPRNKPSDFIRKGGLIRSLEDHYSSRWKLWELRINDSSPGIGQGTLINLIKALCRKFPYNYIPWVELDIEERVINAAVYGQPGFKETVEGDPSYIKDQAGNNDSETQAERTNSGYAKRRERRIAGMKRTIKKYGAPKPWIGYPVSK